MTPSVRHPLWRMFLGCFRPIFAFTARHAPPHGRRLGRFLHTYCLLSWLCMPHSVPSASSSWFVSVMRVVSNTPRNIQIYLDDVIDFDEDISPSRRHASVILREALIPPTICFTP